MIRVEKDNEFPADMLVLKSAKENGSVFIDTLNLDGESNLKVKSALPEIQKLKDEQVWNFDGQIICDEANENLERWEGELTSD